MSNIENLKKQAKQIQRWHRDRRWTVATDIRNALPAFQGLTDREVFEHPFKLADAQAVVAKRYGFVDWPALAAGFASKGKSDNAATEAPEPPSRVEYALPFIFVRDLPAALVFYAERLGFQTEFAYGEPPFYAQVIRDGVRIALKHADEDVCDALESLRRRAQGDELLSANIALDRAKVLFLEYERAGVKFYQTLRRETWGAWSFIVEDPDGNLIAFGGRGEHATARD